MRLLFTLTILFLAVVQCSAQIREISGILTDETGAPLPGVNIVIKGTQQGTVTDVNGSYRISAPVGSVLVISFVGMKTKEVVVANESSNQIQTQTTQKNKGFSQLLLRDSTPDEVPGVAYFRAQSPRYVNKYGSDASNIRSVRRRGSRYVITSTEGSALKYSGYGVNVRSSVSTEHVSRLPSLQSEFGQGRPVGGALQWRGPDTNEIFSWGPAIKTLEFDGSSYPYDKNGRLVPVGTGSGQKATAYDPRTFLKPGLTYDINILAITPAPVTGKTMLSAEHKLRFGIIPNSSAQHNNISLSWKDASFGKTRINVTAKYSEINGSLLQRGANLSTIIYSMLTTPATFDNANGHSPASAVKSSDSWLLGTGDVRSQAPALSSNPYGLINQFPDHENQKRFSTNARVSQDLGRDWRLFGIGSFDRQLNDIVHGFPVAFPGFESGRITDRHDDQNNLFASITPSLSKTIEAFRFDGNASYQINYTQRMLARTDGFGLRNPDSADGADSIATIHRKMNRTIQEAAMNFSLNYYDQVLFKISGRNYFSNTIQAKHINFLPAASLSLNLADILDIWQIQRLEPYAMVSTTMREAPLIYSSWDYSTSQTVASQFTSYYEKPELFFNKTIKPERERKFETGIKFDAGWIAAGAYYFNNQTNDYLAPTWNLDHFEVSNAANVRNTGVNVLVTLTKRNGPVNFFNEARWSTYNSTVLDLASSEPWIPLSGFQSTFTVLAKGRPVGALYGTTYQRNASGQLIIGDDGYPLVHPQLAGSAIPKWTLGWNSTIEWRNIALGFVVEYKRGGQMWNGTAAMLDYLGKSATTAKERHVANYIYDGVDKNNRPNTIPVTFLDPTRPVEESRWVRYGPAGVTEDHIEDASWFRLNEIKLTYQVGLGNDNHQIRFSVFAHNLLLWTPYKGSDPMATMFGYSNGFGLDLFNMPSVRSFGLTVDIKI